MSDNFAKYILSTTDAEMKKIEPVMPKHAELNRLDFYKQSAIILEDISKVAKEKQDTFLKTDAHIVDEMSKFAGIHTGSSRSDIVHTVAPSSACLVFRARLLLRSTAHTSRTRACSDCISLLSRCPSHPSS